MYYRSRIQLGYLYYTSLGLILLLTFIAQSVPLLPKIASVLPLAVLPLVICVGVFNNETVGFVFGLFAGLLCDITSAAYDGWNAILLALIGLGVALLTEYLFNDRLVTTLILSGGFAAVYYLLYWLFFILSGKYDGAWLYLMRFSLPAALYTWAFTLPFYYLIRYVRKLSIRDKDEQRNRGFLK